MEQMRLKEVAYKQYLRNEFHKNPIGVKYAKFLSTMQNAAHKTVRRAKGKKASDSYEAESILPDGEVNATKRLRQRWLPSPSQKTLKPCKEHETWLVNPTRSSKSKYLEE